MVTGDRGLWRLLSERYLDAIPYDQWAMNCLELGYDSPSLRMLAGMTEKEWPSVVDDKLNHVFMELGWTDIPPPVFLVQHARTLAGEILEGRLDPMSGARDICRLLVGNDVSDLGPWYDIDDMLHAQQDFRETGQKQEYYYVEPDELEREIKQACSELLRRQRRSFCSLPETSFEEAEQAFREFLIDNDRSPDIQWIFAEDVIITPSSILVRTPLSPDQRETAGKLYNKGKERDLGMAIHGFADLDNSTLAYIVVPIDDRDAAERSMSPRFLTYSSYRRGFNVESVSNPVRWWFNNQFTNDRKRIGYEAGMPFRTWALAD
jgi:hypothetical protein